MNRFIIRKSVLFGPVARDELRRRSAAAITINMIAQAVLFFLQIASTIALSRMLTPEQFGLVGMASVISNFIAMFRDVGLTQAIIQRETITEAQISTLFWINLSICGFLSVCLAASAPLISWVFDEPRLTWITVALAFPFFVSGFGLQHRALLTRHMHFASIAYAEVTAFAIAVATAVLAAAIGWGVWSLVLMPFVRHLTGSILFIISASWLPGAPRRGCGVMSMLIFGANITGFNVINYFARNADNFIIGKYFGSNLLGQYSRAYGLMILPLTQINVPLGRSLLPALSRLMAKPREYQELYIRYNRMIAWGLCLPIAISAHFGEYLFLAILGEQWRFAGLLFEWLAVASMIQPLTNLTGLVFITTDRTREMFYWGLANSAVVVFGFTVGAYLGGVTGVAVSYAVTNLLLAPICFVIAFKNSPICLRTFAKHVGMPLILPTMIVMARFFM